MPDLPINADRMDDVEIQADAGLSESLHRKYGSNINFILDFLGIPDGSTSVSGTLFQFIAALEIVQGHTITQQATIASNGGTQSVGTYSPQKFLNRVFWLRTDDAPGSLVVADEIKLLKSIDGGSTVQWNASRVTPGSISTNTANTYQVFGTQGLGGGTAIDRSFNNIGNFNNIDIAQVNTRDRYTDGGLGTLGYEGPMRGSEWFKLGVLDYHEFDTSAQVFSNPRNQKDYEIWMSYELNFMSAPLLD